MALHIDYVFDVDMIPRDCIMDCSHAGDCTEDVDHWVSKLELTVDREKAIDCLEGYGAWERSEMEELPEDEIARKILWLACCDFSEGNEMFVLE